MKILRDKCPTCETSCEVELTHWFETPNPRNWPCPNCGTLLEVDESRPVVSKVLRGGAYVAFYIPVSMVDFRSEALLMGTIGFVAIYWLIGKTTGMPRFRAAKRKRDFVKEELEDASSGEKDSTLPAQR